MKLLEAGLLLIIITAIHDGTPQRQEGRVTVPIANVVDAMHECSLGQERESLATLKHPDLRGRTKVWCILKHADGREAELVSPLEIVP